MWRAHDCDLGQREPNIAVVIKVRQFVAVIRHVGQCISTMDYPFYSDWNGA
jgi:hypothetical protein